MRLPKFNVRNVSAWFLLLFGLVTMIMSTTSTIISMVNEEEEAAPSPSPSVASAF